MIFAVIPVKKNSDRVSNKNFRPIFKNQSLLDIKIQQIDKSKLIKKIFISSDSSELKLYERGRNTHISF